jgi:hypothetical protein
MRNWPENFLKLRKNILEKTSAYNTVLWAGKVLGATTMGRRILCLMLFALIAAKASSQEAKFGWSLGDLGWSYNFIGGHDVADFRALNFNMFFEKTPITINTSVMSGTNKNYRKDTDPFYNSFLPLEILYSPFKWKYAHISLYGRGAWEIRHTEDTGHSQEISHGFFGAFGLRVGLFPIQPNFFKYTANIVNVFSEYTTRNEFKLGISVDLLDIVLLGLKIWSLENSRTDENEQHGEEVNQP